MMLAYYERFGPVYTVRLLHRRVVIMLGPEANHLVTVTGAENLSWRRGMFGEELIPLLGDGLITTDGPYHDRARRIMMPAFHHDRMRGAVTVMVQETERSLRSWRPGDVVDVYAWIRDLAMSIAMRALLGLDPHQGEKGHEAAEAFERALSFYDTETWLMMLRGPGSPWARMKASRRRLDLLLYREIAERRRAGADGEDILSMLIDARDEDGERFSDRELRDQITTLLFGGHDTSSSSLSFLLYELARNPPVMARLLAEQRRVLGGAAPTFEQLSGGLLPELDMALDETLRLYPPVWFGPRLAVKDFRFTGYTIPAGTHIVHSSWASHRMPEVFPDPDVFRPERFTPEARRALPKGAYIPFGGGQRICIGKRFGQLVVKTAATLLLQRFRCELPEGHTLRIDKVPTLSPHGGLPMLVRS
jgi:cytochrome P450